MMGYIDEQLIKMAKSASRKKACVVRNVRFAGEYDDKIADILEKHQVSFSQFTRLAIENELERWLSADANQG